MKRKMVLASAVALAAMVVPNGLALADPPVASPADQSALVKSLNKQTGDVTIPQANATLHLGSK